MRWNSYRAALFTTTSRMRSCCPALPGSGVDRAAQPGALGAPSYVQSDHWDQAAHQLFHRSQAPAEQLASAGALYFPLSTIQRFKNAQN